MKKFIWQQLTAHEKTACLTRPSMQQNTAIAEQAQTIVRQVQQTGDAALKALTQKLDGVALTELKVSLDAVLSAQAALPSQAKEALSAAYKNIHAFHHAQLPRPIKVETCPGVVCEKVSRPIQTVGLYIPGGSAPLVSTVLMLGIPAQIAGCPQRILCTPPNKHGEVDPHILYAAQLCGISTIYKIGGAQAIAAMAYGTESIPKVDKIFGPGNAWVTAAKQIVAHDPHACSIDLPAGPSEVMVIADDAANPNFVAADLLSQAEHGADSQVMLVCLSAVFAETVLQAVDDLCQRLPRRAIAEKALIHSAILIVSDLNEAVHIANQYAPEHLIIQTSAPRDLLDSIQCAGSVFLGAFTPESVGDYASGTNHVLPTYGYARSRSGLGLHDFMLHMSVQELTYQGLQHIGPVVSVLAEIEGLGAHGLAVALRLGAEE